MTTRDDVPDNERLAESIRVTVRDVNDNPASRRDVELTVEDETGARLQLITWETHNIDQQWETGQTYEITGARGKRYTRQSGTRVELHSTGGFQAREVSLSDVTRLLVVGDSHVGYRHRPQSDKPSWARGVDSREVFRRCLARAREAGVDAVVHVGDIFDHQNTSADREHVRQEIDRTVNSGIPFYYIEGNHDDWRGRALLKDTPGDHLAEGVPLVGDSPVNLLGVDHSGEGFPTEAPEPSVDMVLNLNILVIHETPYPVVDEEEGLVYKNDSNKADISGFVETADYGIDLVITGHLHVANQLRVRGTNIPVLITGPTIPISSYEKDSRPSTWLLTIGDGDIELERQSL